MSQFFASGGQSISFNISPSNEYSGLISFRMDWLDLFAVQGTLKSLLQHHSSKASILWCSTFFIVQFSHPHMTNGKTIALTRWTFVGKVMSLLFNMLSRLVITLASGLTEFIPFIAPQLSGANPVSSFPLLLAFPQLRSSHRVAVAASARSVFGALIHIWRPEITDGCEISC